MRTKEGTKSGKGKGGVETLIETRKGFEDGVGVCRGEESSLR